MHEDHRKRLRERYLASGLQGMAEHEILELLLTYSIPRIDVNPLAHRLTDRFGSLRAVMDAAANDLRRVDGVGENTAALFALVRDIARLLEMPDIRSTRLTTPDKAAAYLRARLRGLPYETVYALFLASNFTLISERVVSEGTVDYSVVFPRRIVESALYANCAAVILAHNHPGGSLSAGKADRDVTRQLETALGSVGIRLAEHYVVSERGAYGIKADAYYCMQESEPAEAPRKMPALSAVAERDTEI